MGKNARHKPDHGISVVRDARVSLAERRAILRRAGQCVHEARLLGGEGGIRPRDVRY